MISAHEQIKNGEAAGVFSPEIVRERFRTELESLDARVSEKGTFETAGGERPIEKAAEYSVAAQEMRVEIIRGIWRECMERHSESDKKSVEAIECAGRLLSFEEGWLMLLRKYIAAREYTPELLPFYDERIIQLSQSLATAEEPFKRFKKAQ
ncbi:hypothetical protein L0Y49_03695 [bacterium]|nr:hypothetical protein [bacterium]MCI0565687.1 hypothetical protein [bacterium]MCI0680409.1 hypothetical protein [bacterium]